MVSLDKCAGSCKVLSPKLCVPKETKDINIKAFNMMTKKNEAKAKKNIFHVTVSVNPTVQRVIQIKNGMMKHVIVNVKTIIGAKKTIVGILALIFVGITGI